MIPKALRERFRLQPGVEVVFVPHDKGVTVRRGRGLRDLAGALADPGLREELEAQRRAERLRWRSQNGPWHPPRARY